MIEEHLEVLLHMIQPKSWSIIENQTQLMPYRPQLQQSSHTHFVELVSYN